MMTRTTARAMVMLLATTLLLTSACEKNESPPGAVTGPASPQEERVRAIVGKHFDKKPEVLDVASTLESQGLDVEELDVVELVMSVEDELGVSIPDDALQATLGKPADPRKLSIRMLAETATKAPPATGPATRDASTMLVQ